MQVLSSVLVKQPMHVLLVASVYLLLWVVLRLIKSRAIRHPNAMLVPAVFAMIYAGWEWVVTTQTPEANIRVDLLLIWPLQAILSVWALVRAFLK